jgi:hypothetical protein
MHPSRRILVQAALSVPVVLLSSCSALTNNAFGDAKSGGVLMLKLLQEKYSLEFVIASDLEETSSYGTRTIGGKIAAAADRSKQADAYVDSRGNLTDNYSALVFRDQAERDLRAICSQDAKVVNCSVVLTAIPSSDRYDRVSFAEFIKSSGVKVSVHATLASGLSEEVYAAQGWELLNALYAPGLPFSLQGYSGDHFLFVDGWVTGQPWRSTQQDILDDIRMNRDDTPTPR